MPAATHKDGKARPTKSQSKLEGGRAEEGGSREAGWAAGLVVEGGGGETTLPYRSRSR